MGLREQANLKRLNKGDPEAYAQVFDWYNTAIYRHIYFRVSNREIAEDLTSHTFLKVWEYVIRLHNREEQIESHQPIKNIRAFLYRTANNLVIDYYRSKKFQAVELSDEMTEVIAGPDSIAERTVQRDTHEKLIAIVQTLKALDQQLVLMRYVDELSIKEIAGITHLSENSISIRLHRALKKLQKHNEPDGAI